MTPRVLKQTLAVMNMREGGDVADRLAEPVAVKIRSTALLLGDPLGSSCLVKHGERFVGWIFLRFVFSTCESGGLKSCEKGLLNTGAVAYLAS